jgi:hypothetical protein
MNILFIIKMKILVLVKWSYKFPQSCWILSLEWLASFEHTVQSLWNTCLYECTMHLDLLVIHYNIKHAKFIIIDQVQKRWILLVVIHKQTTWLLPRSHSSHSLVTREASKVVFCKCYVLLRDWQWPTTILACFLCYEYGIYVYPAWTMLRIHPPMKIKNYISACVVTNHIFITCCWSIVLYLNMMTMRIKRYKFWLRRSSCHPNQFSICLISMMQYEHMPFMTIHCKME